MTIYFSMYTPQVRPEVEKMVGTPRSTWLAIPDKGGLDEIKTGSQPPAGVHLNQIQISLGLPAALTWTLPPFTMAGQPREFPRAFR